MTYLSKDFTDFLKDLEKNNNRDWFQKNKARYEKSVKKPFESLVSELILRMQAYDPQCVIEPKDAIFRIYRDIRFSKDKTPYKTNVSAVIGRGGRKEKSLTGMYIEIGANHIRVYGGVYMPDKDQLYKLRKEILYNEEEFNKLINDKVFKEYFGEIRGEKNKRLPPEFAELEQKQPLIANKQFYYFSEMKPSAISEPTLIDEIFKRFDASLAVRKFLQAPLED
ncbi:MAG: hypothetical protein Salg2KO_20720 [Salibacteraceae bacterium]